MHKEQNASRGSQAARRNVGNDEKTKLPQYEDFFCEWLPSLFLKAALTGLIPQYRQKHRPFVSRRPDLAWCASQAFLQKTIRNFEVINQGIPD
jgi:hypothetical protein